MTCYGELLEVLKEYMLREKFMEISMEEIYLLKLRKFLQMLVLAMLIYVDRAIMMKIKV